MRLIQAGLWAVTVAWSAAAPGAEVLLNDPHSRLNATWVAVVEQPESAADIVAIVRRAARSGQAISISGGQHSMGGQQFGTGTLHINTAKFSDVIAFDQRRGIVTVEAGIRWPALINYLGSQQSGARRWSIVQKQTGADELSVGGSMSTNIHGRGLTLAPFAQDIEAFRLVTAEGREINVSRRENAELFRLVIGGYGLFGVVTTVDLRLTPRQQLERHVVVQSLQDLPAAFADRIDDGSLYGDFQFKTDESAPDFLQRGVFSTYRPLRKPRPVPPDQGQLSRDDWRRLFALAHTDKASAFDAYVGYYLGTDGQLYWSDTHQLSYYDPDFEATLRQLPGYEPGSLMISELYVPRHRLVDFMQAAARDLKANRANVIYGTIRLIRADQDSFLAWARQDYACVIFNLRVRQTGAGVALAQQQFQQLIDRALERGGSYFLTYHRWARKDQVLAAYPQFPEFLRKKLDYDPDELFQSDWYRYYRRLFAPELAGIR
ncbi:MAG: FAD-binding oxidoreductase [Gammaproteobacteria bacterium]|nr:FAD-binding oxidoreductase [Gammaproteobacteria bacterium]MDH5275688.1 FAD-binding oxidoreductase [Gammaproteobacteria bacterium]